MSGCLCTGACASLGWCPNGSWPQRAPHVGTRPSEPLPLGRTQREPLTEEQVRRIIREELDRHACRERAA